MFSIKRLDQTVNVEFCHGKVNAMDLEFCEGLIGVLKENKSNPDIVAVVLSGNGNVFSAGIDLKRWLVEGPNYVEPFMIRLEELFEEVFCFPKPILSAINGHAIAGGCMLATACDYRLISDSARIGILESRLGVPLPITAIEIVRHVATASAFRKIVSVGATYVGCDAVSAGLADENAIDLGPLVASAIREFSAIPAPAFEMTKLQVRQPVMKMVEQSKSELFQKYLEIWKSQQTRDAIAAYVEQRLS